MAVTLTYDAALARVRINANGLAAANVATVERSTDLVQWTTVRGGAAATPTIVKVAGDTFSHAEVNGWGVAEVGGRAWFTAGGVAADYSISGGLGRISITAVNSIREMRHFVDLVNGTTIIDILPTVLPLTAGHEYMVQARAGGPGTNSIDARLVMTTTNTVTIEARQTLDGVTTSSGAVTVPGATATTALRVKVQHTGGTILATAWPVGGTEPAPQATLPTTVLVVGRFNLQVRLLAGCTNVLPVLATFDNYEDYGYEINVDDYEFVSGVQNTYRVRGVSTDPVSLFAHTTTVTDANAAGTSTLSPTLPGGVVDSDVLLVSATIRNKGAGSVAVPATWSELVRNNNISLLGKTYATGVAAPTISFTGGVANATITAKMFVLRNASLTPATTAADTSVLASQANIPSPAMTVPVPGCAIVACGWRQDDATSVAPIAGLTEIQDQAVTAGDDAHVTIDVGVQTTAADIAASSWVVTGGVNAIPTALLAAFAPAPYLNEQTANITPVLDRIWLKSVQRPFLNRAVTVVEWSEEERPSRAAAFAVVGRTLEIGVTDVAGGIVFTLDLYAANRQDAQTLDYIRASGDILYLHTPAGCEIPGGHVCVDTSSSRRPRPRGSSRVFSLPLRQCAAPGPDVVGTTVTWQSVLNLYPSWAALLAANPTWADLLARVAAPSEVIVP